LREAIARTLMLGNDMCPGGGPYTIAGWHAHSPLYGTAGSVASLGGRYEIVPGSLMNPPQV